MSGDRHPDTYDADGNAKRYIIDADVLDAERDALLMSAGLDKTPAPFPHHMKLWEQLTHAEPIADPRFLNSYRCDDCNAQWTDIWPSDEIENECASCGTRHLYPIASVELEPIEYHRRPVPQTS